MTLFERVQQDLSEAMKAREKERLDTLRMMKSALKNEEISVGGSLDDAAALKVLMRLCKQRKESIEQFERGGRPDLAAREATELAVIETYLPQAPDEAAVRAAVTAVVAEIGVTSSRDMGRVIKAVMERFAGQPVDGRQVSQEVRAQLGG